MCGIVGYITSVEPKKVENLAKHFMHYALFMDTLRGADSTGLIEVVNDFDVKALKSIKPGTEFINCKEYKERSWLKEALPWCGIGHNRAATKGSVKLDNAHPFLFGDVCMVHNGTLQHHGSSLDTFQKDFEVDSMQIAYALSQHEPDDVRKVLEQIDGSFALVWTDKRDQSINMARNSSRPMHFAWDQDNEFLMFMSDGHMLAAINKSLGAWKATTVYSVDTYRHLKWKKGSLEPVVSKFDPFVRQWSGYSPPARTETNGSTPVTAAEKAADRWNTGRGVPSGHVYSTGGTKVWINRKNREIPNGHLEMMRGFFQLEPDERLVFTPERAFDLSETTCMVTGEVLLHNWGDATWPCVLMDVPLVTYNGHMNNDWLIQPIGMADVMGSGTKHLPGLKGRLIQCVVPKREKSHRVTIDPSRMSRMERALLEEKLKDGCVNCGCMLWISDCSEYTEVNEGRDILCHNCWWDEEIPF